MAGFDDTALTTASTMTAGGKKSRAKKATTAKGKKTKAKKDEPAEAVEEVQPAEVHETSPAAPPTKAKRGKKRTSDAIEESTLTLSQAPAPKKRATRTRGSAAVESSVLQPPEDEEMVDAPASKKAAGKTKGRASNTRKVSTKKSLTSAAAIMSPPGYFPDDDEIERQLEAELENSFTDDEHVPAVVDFERSRIEPSAPAPKHEPHPSQEQARTSADFAIFDPAPAEVDDDAVEDELEALRAEMETDEPRVVQEPEVEPELEPGPEPEKLHVPKKTTKGGTRKASKQTKAKKPPPSPEPIVEETEQIVEEPKVEEPKAEILDDQDASVGSTDTVIKSSGSQTQGPVKRGRGRPSKTLRESYESVEDELAEIPAEPPKKQGRGRPPKVPAQEVKPIAVPVQEPPKASVPKLATEQTDQPKKRGRGRPSKASLLNDSSEDIAVKADEPVKRGRGRPSKKSSEAPNRTDPEVQLLAEAEAAEARLDVYDEEGDEDSMELVGQPDSIEDRSASPEAEGNRQAEAAPSTSDRLLDAPSTPGAQEPSPSASARQANLSPSQSPQSSDAENQPPSSVPAASVKTKRVALAPVAVTPSRGSPSKRNVIAGLKSQTPWKTIDIDAVMGTPMAAGPDKENAGVDRLLRKGKDLSSPEKKMTVEEWIHFNASEAEKLLKHECEAMVSRFENEGTKAMGVLESLVVDE